MTRPTSDDPQRQTSSLERLLTVPEVAALLQLTTKGVYSLVEGRRIPFIRISNRVRFRQAELERWLEAQTVAPIERRR